MGRDRRVASLTVRAVRAIASGAAVSLITASGVSLLFDVDVAVAAGIFTVDSGSTRDGVLIEVATRSTSSMAASASI